MRMQPRAVRLIVVGTAVAVGLLAAARAGVADVRLPAVIGDGMVLQQHAQVPLWGWADPGEKVTVKTSWDGAEATAVADEKGAWEVRVKTPAAQKPKEGAGAPAQTVTITGKNQITLRDVLIGEVWVCSGQSNMEMSVSSAANGPEEVKGAEYPEIRLFNVPNTIAPAPRLDCQGKWARCSAQTVGGFSAVGYFYGRNLYRSLGVPIGLIESDWGGTVAEAWTSEEAIKSVPEFADALAAVVASRDEASKTGGREALLEAWRKHLDMADPGSHGGADGTAAYSAADFDDSAWETLDVPSAWGGDLASFDGILWCRRVFDVPAAWAGREAVLELGPIDDMDVTWVNGTRVGQMMGEGGGAQWQTPRVYTVPAGDKGVKAGRNVIAVRVLDTGGTGGFVGRPDQLRLRPRPDNDAAFILLAGKWKYRVGAPMSALPRPPAAPGSNPNVPTVLYNGMIAPIVPYGIRGAIWYQGESNRERAYQYRSLFPAMIGDWRKHWGQGDFPFYFVQIAPFGYGGDKGETAELREAQMMALRMPNTGMAVTMDIGNPRDIHPTNKQEVGRRLSLWALARTYGRSEVACSGPLYKSMKAEGRSIRLSFNDAAGGLVCAGPELTCFTIAGADRKFVGAKAVIDGETAVVSSDAVPEPVAVRFAWGAADEPNLRNKAGLPASSFRTDDWPG